ncbi:NAD-dependent epimerase/dehydratase family protein [bacterium D16-50]|jgi:UDP-glucose 4-epimerase|nr:NAD-dependent epimerase/dehydratase family protein [Lachnospiraceae bacterium]RKJ20065.1 NAD-dependent epimerase/dehydratase family protein [bacterium D16-50]
MLSIKGKTVLVTGGAGFIGSHLCDTLLEKGAGKVVCLDNFFLGKMENLQEATSHENFVLYHDDARNFGTVQAILGKEQVDVVFNLATIALNYSFFNPFDAYMVNVEIANTLLELLKMEQYRTLIHVSSSEAYGSAKYSPMDENHPTDPTTPYAAGKAAADLMIHSFSKVLDLDISIIRPFNNFGPRQNAEGPLAAIIPATARKIRQGETPMIEGTGEQTRDFIYVKDTVRALVAAYENEDSRGKIINIGSGSDISINYLMKKICDYLGYDGEIERRESRKSDVQKLCASSDRAKKYLGFTPEYTFEEALKETLDWYIKHAKL